MNKTRAILNFLSLQADQLGNISPIAQFYTEEMEVQVNVIKEGEIITGESGGKKWQGYTDGVEVWKPFRIPWDAYVNPSYNDSPLNYSLVKYAQAIGMTGWNWKRRQSVWVGYDFDSLTTHKEGLTDEELNEILERVKTIPYITIYKSTSGTGFHLYILLENSPQINTHTEHAALARAILAKLSVLVNFQFNNQVDTCGGILWVWKRSATGFQSIKEGEVLDPIEYVPDWREHIDVCLKSKRKSFISETKGWKTIYRGIKHIDLDDSHITLMRWLEENKKLWWWDNDHHMLVTHTHDLKQAHETLHLKGVFETIASGRDSGRDQNCFAFPLPKGCFIIRRHTPGTTEHSSWSCDKSGWTYCFYNRIPTISFACLSAGGVEVSPDVFHFKSLLICNKTLSYLQIPLELKPEFYQRPAKLRIFPENKLKISFEWHRGDEQLEGWHYDEKKSLWERIVTCEEVDEYNFDVDHIIRHLVSNERDAGWFILSRSGWTFENRQHVVDVLTSNGLKRGAISKILGSSILDNWELVNIPFQEEYPGNRQWNKHPASLAFEPLQGQHPTWDLVYSHCGKNLNDAVRAAEWCKQYGILSGADYLLTWTASLFQFPLEPLPYLFFYGPQNSGKSTFHESLSLLFRNGYARADVALTSKGSFNGELEGAVLCVVEEVNLQKSKESYEKIKDWVTASTISIHPKGRTPYLSQNTTHWIQCANNPGFCPIFPGDSRIVVTSISPIGGVIPKKLFIERLTEEARYFLYTLLNLKISLPIDRLRIPVLSTQQKEVQQEINASILDVFIAENCYRIDGHAIPFAEFYEKFMQIVPMHERGYWSQRRVALCIPEDIPRGKTGQFNVTCLGNMTWEQNATPRVKLARIEGRLTHA